MLRVLFDAAALRVPLAGVGQYTLRLAQALAALGTLDLDFFDGAAFSRELRCDPSPARAAAYGWARRWVPGAYRVRRWLQQRRFDAGAAGHDLYHEPGPVALDFRGPTVITVHDLSWIRHPEAHPRERVRDLERRFEPGLRRASLVLTGSEFIRREIAQVFAFDAARIEVVPHGCDPIFRPRDAAGTAAARARHGLEHGGYFLSVGTLEPRKNLRVALQAHAQLPASLRRRCPLVLAGMQGWGEQPDPAEVRSIGYLERDELACLVAGATALVYPSRYEGFGLPPLEAMACGVPPITSDASSLPEVVGDAGIMVDPDDVPGWCMAMQALATDPSRRAMLSARSLARARSFTWEASAAATARAYARAVRDNP